MIVTTRMSTVNKVFVNSSNVESLAYDANTQVLTVDFLNGRTYEYSSVPPEKAARLTFAESVGAFLNKNIKGKHPYVEVTDEVS